MISDKRLLKLENDRQLESDYILQKIDLLHLLEKYGEVNIVGAKALGLMVAKDIDISVVIEKMDYEIWKKLVGDLMTTSEVRKVTAIDYYNYDSQNRYDPIHGQKYSLYVEMDTLIGRSGDKFDVWNCQIHLIERKAFLSTSVRNLKAQLTAENKIFILRLKYWASQVNAALLPKTSRNFKIQSTEIYPLVLSGQVHTKEEFIKHYLPKVGDQFKEITRDAMVSTEW